LSLLSRYYAAMPLYELHTFADDEVAKVSHESGIFVLYQVENPVAAESASDLRRALGEAKAMHPRATHFAIEILPSNEIADRLRSVKNDLSRVRKSTFMGSTPR
jgi:hypothetical protein